MMSEDAPDSFSQQLLEREKKFRLKNKQITSQMNEALERVEIGVKEGVELLSRPALKPQVVPVIESY